MTMVIAIINYCMFEDISLETSGTESARPQSRRKLLTSFYQFNSSDGH